MNHKNIFSSFKIADKRRQQESRVEQSLSLEKLTSVGRCLNWCGRKQHILRFFEWLYVRIVPIILIGAIVGAFHL